MKFFSYILIFILLINLVSASDYTQEFNIIDKETNINIIINFDYAKNFNFNLILPNDVTNVNVLIDNKFKDLKVTKYNFQNLVNINGTASDVKISYSSKDYIENGKNNYFTAEISSLLNSELKIKVILPAGATLNKPFKNNIEETSIYPKPKQLTTNGENIIIAWDYNAQENETFPLFIIYNIKSFNYIYLILILLIFFIIIFLLIKKRKRKVKIKKIKIDDIEKHLKEEEKLVINILKQKLGECTQATLVTLTNMSKASLSRLLNELESRNIIRKEQKGNKNLIILKKR